MPSTVPNSGDPTRVAGLRIPAAPKPTWMSSARPATCVAAYAATNPNANASPYTASPSAAAMSISKSVGVEPVAMGAPPTTHAESASTSATRAGAGIWLGPSTGAMIVAAATRMETSSVAISHPMSMRNDTGASDVVGDAADDLRGVSPERAQQPAAEQQQGRNRCEQLRHEGKRRFLNLRDDLQNADCKADERGNSDHRRRELYR